MCSRVGTGGSTLKLKATITTNQETYIGGDLHMQEAAAGCIEIYSGNSERYAHLKSWKET